MIDVETCIVCVFDLWFSKIDCTRICCNVKLNFPRSLIITLSAQQVLEDQVCFSIYLRTNVGSLHTPTAQWGEQDVNRIRFHFTIFLLMARGFA